ncbi:hypothetical protein EYZ11_007748 [Aspergillus tanneri]|uniref:Uncharacterized protein n=1 Tax=Aspergillus tanneri TaxID=1220188 RepID=A0A4S3JEG2_9EURO|nr:hypothetical protein EYZ11_007748 [Aspergillus tanneri]
MQICWECLVWPSVEQDALAKRSLRSRAHTHSNILTIMPLIFANAT